MKTQFYWTRRPEVVDRIAKLARRAAKLGLPFEARVSAEPVEQTTDDLGNVYRWGEVDLTQPTLALPGDWSLVAVLSPVPLEDGSVELLPSAAPGQELPAGVRTWTFRCDHCQTERRRSETFVVRDAAGTVKQVGRNCLSDFLGHDAAAALSRYDFIAQLEAELNEFGFGGSARVEFLQLQRVMTVTSAVVRRRGFVSARAANESPRQLVRTSSLVHDWMFGRDVGRDHSTADLRAECPVGAEDEQAAADAAAHWQQVDEQNEYVENAKLLVRSGLVPMRAFGLAVSLLPVAQRSAEIARERATRRENVPAWTAGRVEVSAEVLSAQWKESDFGSYLSTTVRLDDGRTLWFRAPASLQFTDGRRLSAGDRVLVRLTVAPKQDDPTFAFGKRPTLLNYQAKEAA